ncbi:MAG: hypothetical protein ACK4ND_08545 [Cytophagaceae bacterium]
MKESDDVQVSEGSWTEKDDVITYRLEYDSDRRLKKESRYVNDNLHTYQTYEYFEDMVVQKNYNHNSILKNSYHYSLDEHKRVDRYDIKDAEGVVITKKSIQYSESGFPVKYTIDSSSSTPVSIDLRNDGNNITEELVGTFHTSYTPSDIVSNLSIPYELPSQLIPSYTGLFGKTNKYLLKNSLQSVAGPSGGAKSIIYAYSYGSEGRVKEIKCYLKEYARRESPPNYGTVQLVKYEYVFD